MLKKAQLQKQQMLNPNSDVYILMKNDNNQNICTASYWVLFFFSFLPIKNKIWRRNKPQSFSHSGLWELSWIRSHNTLFWLNCVLDDSCAASVFRFRRLQCYFTVVGERQNLVLCFFTKGNKVLSDKNTVWQAQLQWHLESKLIFTYTWGNSWETTWK